MIALYDCVFCLCQKEGEGGGEKDEDIRLCVSLPVGAKLGCR